MAFRIQRHSIARELRRLARKELGAAIERLEAGGADEADIHSARKGLKKVRAIVKLLRAPLGSKYAAENDRLRAAGHRLSRLRDADAMPQTLQALHARYSLVITRTVEESVARGLRSWRREVRSHGAIAVGQAAQLLKRARRTLPRRLARAAGWSPAQAGLIRGYQRSKSAMADLAAASGAVEFHEWRRRVKEHWYQVRLFEARHPAARARARSLKTLESTLGEDHNLALFGQILLRHSDRLGGARTTSLVIGCIQKRQRALRRRALASGHRLFASKPKTFEATVQRWRLHRR